MKDDQKKSGGLFGGRFFAKLKSVKHIEIVVVLILCAVCVLIFMSSLGKKEGEDDFQTTYSGLEAYAVGIENRLSSALSSLKGVGSVDVMVTFDGEIEYVYAKDEETKQNSITNGSSTTTTTTSNQTMLFENGAPVVIKELMPDVLGVVIIASGAENVSVKLNIIKAVETLLNVPSTKIEVLVGK